MHEPNRRRRAGEFATMDLGVRAAKAICDRFGAEVTDYSAEGRRASITLRMPSRRELFHRSIQKSRAVMEESERARRRSADAVVRTEANRRTNRVLRSSLAEVKQALAATRIESRSIMKDLSAGSAQQPVGH